MSNLPDKYIELIYGAAENIHHSFQPDKEEDAKLVQKGLMLYRQKLVTKVTLDEQGVIGMVQDVTKVQVYLDLSFVQRSRCTCPSLPICKHQLAVFFYMYSQIDSVTDWVEKWRKPLKEKELVKSLGLERAKGLYAAKTKKADYDEWVRSFETIFHSIIGMQKRLQPHFMNELFQLYMRKVKTYAPIEKEWKDLYELIATVHSFVLLKTFTGKQNFDADDVERQYGGIFFELADDAHYLVNKLHIQALPFAFDQFIEKLMEDTILILQDEEIIQNASLELYFVLWKRFFTRREWREAELARLKANHIPNYLVVHGIIFQHILLKQDDEALALFKRYGTNSIHFLLYILSQFAEDEDWKRVSTFVDFFISKTKEFLSDEDHYESLAFTRDGVHLLHHYAEQSGRMDLLEKFFVEAIPYSYHFYDEHLFNGKQYEKWADLQALIGYQIDSISQVKLKLLEKEAPHVLLPLYHQAVEANIQLKSRGNYRVAVRYLKKLRTLYKKLKRQDDWKTFLQILLEKTKRLRAFQEECERGKLFSDKLTKGDEQ